MMVQQSVSEPAFSVSRTETCLRVYDGDKGAARDYLLLDGDGRPVAGPRRGAHHHIHAAGRQAPRHHRVHLVEADEVGGQFIVMELPDAHALDWCGVKLLGLLDSVP